MTHTTPLSVSSGDLIADRRYQWALDLAARGDFAATAEILAQAVERAPGFAAAWFALGEMRDRLGDRDGAIAAFLRARDADRQDRHGASLQLARLGVGAAAPAMSQDYVRGLFDQYAARYDTALTEKLAYRGPELLFNAVAAVTRAAGRPMHFGVALDLGCGTGLAGAAFRPVVGVLTGVDLSPAMIARAAAKKLYDRLVTAPLADALADERAQARRYDLVLAADVFVYVNDLAPILRAVAAVLAADGLFAFTVETHGGDGVALLPTLRFAYGEAYMREALALCGLTLADLGRQSVRCEKGQPIDSLVAVATR
jgi:predicted TPR repeat methyltransferase